MIICLRQCLGLHALVFMFHYLVLYRCVSVCLCSRSYGFLFLRLPLYIHAATMAFMTFDCVGSNHNRGMLDFESLVARCTYICMHLNFSGQLDY